MEMQVALILRGEDKPAGIMPKARSRSKVVFDGCDLQDYTCDSYHHEMDRHMQLVME